MAMCDGARPCISDRMGPRVDLFVNTCKKNDTLSVGHCQSPNSLLATMGVCISPARVTFYREAEGHPPEIHVRLMCMRMRLT